MTSPYRTIGRDELRAVLLDESFATPAAGVEAFDLGVEGFPVHWQGGAAVPAPLHGPGGTLELATRVASEAGLFLAPPGAEPGPGGGLHVGIGGQLGVTAMGATPLAAVEEFETSLGLLTGALGAQGIQLVSLGQSPWHLPEQLESLGAHGAEPVRSLDEIYAESGALGRSALRSAGTLVRIGFGGAIQRALRWRAAELLAPLASAMFASSPLTSGGHDGFKSERARARGIVDPTRTGWPVPSATGGDHVDSYLEFALAARIVGVNHGGSWTAPIRPLSFDQWIEHGIEGRYPDLDDWRAHLDTLAPEVFPSAGIELRGLDALPAPFHSVPLLLFTALLTDPGTAQAVVDRLEPSAGALRERWALAARSGLLDMDFGEEAGWVFGRAAQSLLRLPERWFSRPLLSAFVAFGRRFARRGLTPADEILDLFLERGQLGQGELEELQRRWNRAAGVQSAAA